MTEKYRNIQHKLTRFFKCRHLVWLTVLCIALAGCKDDFDDSELRKQIADLDGRLTTLEKLCAQMNTNISSMQTIVNALQQNDYITGVTPSDTRSRSPKTNRSPSTTEKTARPLSSG